ncbi:hypothetical protein CGLO_04481 [Colletotrichum gloeosporioides Cg-14]|uniref:Uncharacterized protein n=1 Tax=Colletotrichum gloeosporioides (strain Cg-14) TaxID=1237896 RepID=T0KSD2_COLGC|nr:hypothetical protein CGLO_04481 [Colletotrichum gloeosporioides Cg-14]
MENSRITTSSTGQYDLLLAMSQDSINEALKAMWDVEGDNIAKISIDGNEYGIVARIEATIEAPNIQVIADGTGRGTAI